ncbi:MAG: hypothetical protein U0271_40685 [Polyangiaceae bacterium]
MTSLPPWVALSLRESIDEAGVVRALAGVGVHAEVTRDGIQLPGGFLARVAPTKWPARALDRSLFEGEVDLGAATLNVSGGSNELARSEHWQPAALKREARRMVEERLGMKADPNARVESNASRKMTRLTEIIAAMAPLTSAIVLPKANQLVLEPRAFAADAAHYREGAYAFPLWAYSKVRQDADCPVVATVGMWVFGLPDLAMPLPLDAGIEVADAVRALGVVQREMVAEGLWPATGDTFTTESGLVRVERIRGNLFVVPDRVSRGAALERARARYSIVTGFGAILGDHTLHHRPADDTGIAIEHFLRAGGDDMALTNGLSLTELPTGARVEVAVTSRALGPWADAWLRWVVFCLRNQDPARPIQANDRLVLPEPKPGVDCRIAGAILWPMGHLNPAEPGGPVVELWDLVPFTVEELADFRAAPDAQRRWMDERVERGEIQAIQARFATGAR